MVKRHKKSRYKALKIIFTILICIFLLASVVGVGVGLAIIKNSPNLNVNQVLNLNEPSILYDDKGNFMDVVVSTEHRTVVPFSNIPDNLKNAFVSIEDERFYKHNGIDIKRIFGVIFIDIKNKITNKPGLQGASTITQQLVRDIYLSRDVSFKRKLQEMYMSIKLEKLLTKDQILEAYMNTIFLGGKSFGVESASQAYFGKSVSSLNLIESAFIAGIPQSPSVYYPYSNSAKKNPSIYLDRTKSVLKKMYDNNYITQNQYTAAIQDISNGKLVIKPYSEPNNRLENEWFSMPAIQQVKNDLKLKYKYSDSQVNQLLTYGGLKIYTTMDKELQKKTEDILTNSPVFSSGSYSDKNGILQPQASAVVINYHTGEVKSLVGGRGMQPAMSFNRAASENYLRPPGSSIKPLTVYSPAINTKKYTAGSVLKDANWSYDTAQKYNSNGSPYYPQDDSAVTGSDMTLRMALTKSINTIASKIEDKIGLDTGASYAEKFGISIDNDDRSSISALSLGELHHGTNTLQMAAAYGVFGNNGIYTSPRLYTKVTDRSGKVILESKTKTKRVLPASTAYIMYDLLKGPVSQEGTGANANFGNMQVRGKTGTSSYNKNLWFSGLTPYYSAAVWIGKDNNSTLPGSLNSNSAAALWAAIMEPFHNGLLPKDIPMPSGVETAKICSESGKLPSPLSYLDPTGNKVYTELFLRGTVPTETCNLPHSWFKGSSTFGNTDTDDKTLKNGATNDTDDNDNNPIDNKNVLPGGNNNTDDKNDIENTEPGTTQQTEENFDHIK
ncbi:MAG: PBP1A family penicillin-binding protein [Clostridium sp.]|uniref:transglycosylase domain-containing protein n=1 Tax=Clostridium sp. TaxID=1506 RepID=UPI0025C4B65B|nr:PBP1A family penicillin-binding protein [Clostridium sp.]MCH3962872.1 PBP1A family penicillin-binding protein [Clostridium sp.]MCI1715713.1 PBP1A family penicillin-binding protein [Clostridium sp.]MCI1800082.1 PBP1A family penicillin-binding protein [Clostridium sp.]MCI1813996.1 PBP1A family penicillin-binding protein [Clostridium sp.]MCI1870894.1 PBP1A family penicillin-binding protein [Clostridium sp.]